MTNPLLNLPPLDALRGFVATARRLSITAAARDLCLTQSAVSRQIQALEARLGTPLLVRGKRQIALTDAGRQLFALASPWLDQLADLAASLRPGTRPVTISASIGVASLWLLPRLGDFQAAHPGIDLRVETSNRVMDLAREGVDLAIRYSPAAHLPAAHLPANPLHLFAEELVPVASPAVAAGAFRDDAALARQVLLELDDPAHPFLQWAPWLQACGVTARPARTLRFNQYDQLIQAAIEGNGVALGRVALILPALRDGRLLAQPGRRRAVGDYGYWLLQADVPRPEAATVRDWLLGQVAATVAELARLPD